MKHKLIITNYHGQIAAALYKDQKAAALSLEERDSASILGNIYIGKVARVVKNIQAAFVEIEGGLPCYLSLEETVQPIFTNRINSRALVQGDELLVQVTRESVKTKAPSVTANLSLAGKYLVLTSGNKQISVSSKLNPIQKKELLETAAAFADERFGWIVRTNAAESKKEELTREAADLTKRFLTLCETAKHRPCRSCLYRNPPAWLAALKDIRNSEYEQIVTDDKELYHQIHAYLSEYQPCDLPKLSFYEDHLLPLAKLYSLESAFGEALRERVWLKSGAYLVIQTTEALTSIDVNTGKCEHGKHAEETFYKINLEAAHEIARQLRLRNLSGMILIDFINMKSKESEQMLMEALNADLKNDSVKACVVDMTKLGLVEVTRKRVRKPLAEKVKNFS